MGLLFSSSQWRLAGSASKDRITPCLSPYHGIRFCPIYLFDKALLSMDGNIGRLFLLFLEKFHKTRNRQVTSIWPSVVKKKKLLFCFALSIALKQIEV
jgi:hypothetical protein